jgi:hypothetical protein
MDAYEARELAFGILMEFEEILEEYNVTILSADRKGREQEVRLCETEYCVLEDAITGILRRYKIIRSRERGRVAFRIIGEIEKTLCEAGVSVPPGLSTTHSAFAHIGQKEYERLREAVIRLLAGERPGSGSQSQRSFRPSDEAGVACEQMRRRMAEAAAGMARRG